MKGEGLGDFGHENSEADIERLIAGDEDLEEKDPIEEDEFPSDEEIPLEEASGDEYDEI